MAPPTPIKCSKDGLVVTTNWLPCLGINIQNVGNLWQFVHTPTAILWGQVSTSHNAKFRVCHAQVLPKDEEGPRPFVTMQWTAYIDQTPSSETQQHHIYLSFYSLCVSENIHIFCGNLTRPFLCRELGVIEKPSGWNNLKQPVNQTCYNELMIRNKISEMKLIFKWVKKLLVVHKSSNCIWINQ